MLTSFQILRRSAALFSFGQVHSTRDEALDLIYYLAVGTAYFVWSQRKTHDNVMEAQSCLRHYRNATLAQVNNFVRKWQEKCCQRSAFQIDNTARGVPGNILKYNTTLAFIHCEIVQRERRPTFYTSYASFEGPHPDG